MLRDIVYSVCCAGALLSGVAMVEDVRGMEMVAPMWETVHISDRAQFLAITPEQAKGIKSISFENQDVDEDFCKHWCDILSGKMFDLVSFEECNFNYDFYIFDGLAVANLIVKNCHVNADSAGTILRVDPYTIKQIDLSFNEFGKDEITFEQALSRYVYGKMPLEIFDLRSNGLSEVFKGDPKHHFFTF